MQAPKCNDISPSLLSGRMSHRLDLSDIFSLLDSDKLFWQEYDLRVIVYFLAQHFRRSMISVCPSITDAEFDHLLSGDTSSFYYKSTFSPMTLISNLFLN